MSKEILNPNNWVELYADMIYRFALVRVKDPDAADELFRATFFVALKSQHTFSGKSSKKNPAVWNTEAQSHGSLQKLKETYFNRSEFKRGV